MGISQRFVALLAIMSLALSTSVLGQAQVGAVTVRMKNGSTTKLETATILLKSDRGYVLGAADQQFGGVFTTPPLVPAAGVSLDTTMIPWKDIARLSLGDLREESPGVRRSRATVEMRDGTKREVFTWTPTIQNLFLPGYAPTVKGTTRIDQQQVQVSIGAEQIASIEFD